MGGIANGIAYHGGLLPYVATFLNFSDYMRGSVRLAALSGLHVVYVWTHDSIGVGEDGPTHQPVEHYAALRAMPNLTFVRPGDPNEASPPGRLAVEHRAGPVALALTRQKLPVLAGHRRAARARACAPGGYVLAEAATADGTVTAPELILIATGSELALAVAAREALDGRGHPDARRLDAQLGALRGAAGGLPRRGPAARRDRPRQHRGRRLAGLGALGRRPAAPSSPSTASGSRRRPSRSSSASASPPRTSSRVARGVLAGEIRGVVSARRRARRRHRPSTPLEAR